MFDASAETGTRLPAPVPPGALGVWHQFSFDFDLTEVNFSPASAQIKDS